MSHRAGPAWLDEFQARFGAALRAPLDRTAGVLQAEVSAYDPHLRDDIQDAWWGTAPECLAVYNRQYWFRLFTVMQQSFPLTTALVGAWAFNDLAARFLLAHGPTSWDIERVADGFRDHLPALLDELSSPPAPGVAPVLAAAHLDEAWRQLLRAPVASPFRPSGPEAARLLTARLRPSPSVVLLAESWPLLALRRTLPSPGPVVPLPAPLAAPQSWALVRRSAGIEQVALEPGEAALLRLLRQHSVLDALGLLEADCPGSQHPELPYSVQRWLARSVELGAWSGLHDDPAHDSTQL